VESQRVLQQILEDKQPDAPDSVVVLVGAGADRVYRKILSPYQDIIRVGLAHRGDVDLFCDVCTLPIADNTVDFIFSSSVLEHVYDPEQAVREMYRVVKPGGHVYAEIPFMRGFHLEPIDYQRYTISGIEALFARHRFSLCRKGVCSGPCTAVALHIIDFWKGALSFNRYIRAIGVLLFRLLLHPFKYVDRLCESSSWTNVTACNFYYLGFKEARTEQ
jgi:SAM-dependent methyltransferase